MKTIIIYYSKTGFTEKYSQWLAESVSCRAVRLSEAGGIKLDDYDMVVFASWIHAGQIQKLSWIKKQQIRGKRVVLAVGSTPPGASTVQELTSANFQKEQGDYQVFYLPGGLNYERMGGADRLLMKAFAAMLDKLKNKTEEQRQMAKAVKASYDISDRKYLQPVIEYINNISK